MFGVGKFIFIEVFGKMLIGYGLCVVVLVVDFSLVCLGGLIFGDKIWMEIFSCDFCVFICFLFLCVELGGVVCCICEIVWLCEGVGFDVVLIEIVGVG